MPKFFVCETGPMGGISIVFVADEKTDALRWRDRENAASGRELFIYERVVA